MTYKQSAQYQKELMAESMGLPSNTYTRTINVHTTEDYGCAPLGDGLFRMVPSGDIVDATERAKRLKR